MKKIMTALFLLIAGGATAQETAKTATIVIHTSAECGQCEERLETGLNYTKGVLFAELNMQTMDVTVKYNTKKTNPAALRKVITDLGYDADDQKADAAAQQKLPECCRPGGMEKKH